MPEDSRLFKDNFFSPSFVKDLAIALTVGVPKLDKKKFEQLVIDKDWKNKELKQRSRHIVDVMTEFLPSDFPKAAEAIVKSTNHLLSKVDESSNSAFGYICLAEYIEVHGVDHYKESVSAIEVVTQFMTCEFAVRPFIIKYRAKMMKQMLKWSKHKSAKVRRLASEGCRPRLPWGIALQEFKKDPSEILPILENLKNDDDVWVRKSVANNLNDISKDNPEAAIKVFKSWIGSTKNTDWVVKHAARTLLKAGDQEVMKLFGLGRDKSLKLSGFTIDTPNVKNGKDLHFSFSVTNSSKQTKLVRLEYGMYYLRANGSHSKKVFKISEKEYKAGEKTNVERKQSFKAITTRRYYTGMQKVSIIINGHEEEIKEFNLVD